MLGLVAQIFLANKWVKKVEVQGHTDSQGRDAFNLKLSQKRAESVRAYLIERGVPALSLEAKGYGETMPIASNRTRSGRAKNRRVEFVIVDPPDMGTPSTQK